MVITNFCDEQSEYEQILFSISYALAAAYLSEWKFHLG